MKNEAKLTQKAAKKVKNYIILTIAAMIYAISISLFLICDFPACGLKINSIFLVIPIVLPACTSPRADLPSGHSFLRRPPGGSP